MEHLHWIDRPQLRRPVLVSAFEGWNDAGDASSSAVRWFAERLGAEQIASIDAEEFYDFTAVRPTVHNVGGGRRAIEWPDVELWAASVPEARHDLVLLVGDEPQLKWRTFCATILHAARELGVEMVVTLGALLAEVPHTRPTSVIGTADDPRLIDQLGLRPSTYEGPTGITGVLQATCREAHIPSASLWAAVPTYVPSSPSPKATYALVNRSAALLGIPIVTTDLEIAAASYERQIDELVEADDETAAYVAQLAEDADEDADDDGTFPPLDESQSAALVQEVERFLREHPTD